MMRRALALLIVATAAFGSTARTERRVYMFRCFDERGAQRQLLYAAQVEGPEGTDFQIVLHDARHHIEATFVNEPLPSGGIDARIHLRSRRSWGLSPNGLPLWEEDDQRQSAQIGPDEQIDLLPLGGGGEAGLLKLEITPDVEPSMAVQPLSIHISQAAPQGAIEVSAYRSPHWYMADIALMRNGAAVAHATSRLFVDDGATVSLGGTAVHITPSVVPYENRWAFVAVRMDITSMRAGAAVVAADTPATFPIDDQQKLIVTLHPEGGPTS